MLRGFWPIHSKLPAGTYTLALAGANEELNATGDLDLRDAVTIRGDGAEAAERRLRDAIKSCGPVPLLQYALGDLLRRGGRRVEAENTAAEGPNFRFGGVGCKRVQQSVDTPLVGRGDIGSRYLMELSLGLFESLLRR